VSTFAVIKAGGHQYRVAAGDTIFIEAADGAEFAPTILMMVDGSNVVTDADKLAKATVTGTVVGRVRQRMERTMHFKGKKSRSNKRTMGHRRERNRIKIDKVAL
jgi:large subunit ribosomal protein L21